MKDELTVSREQRPSPVFPLGTLACMLSETLIRFSKQVETGLILQFEKGSLLHLVESFPSGDKNWFRGALTSGKKWRWYKAIGIFNILELKPSDLDHSMWSNEKRTKVEDNSTFIDLTGRMKLSFIDLKSCQVNMQQISQGEKIECICHPNIS